MVPLPTSGVRETDPCIVVMLYSLRGITNILEIGPDASQEYLIRTQLQIFFFLLFPLECLQLEANAEKVPKVAQEADCVIREGAEHKLGHVVLREAEMEQHEALVGRVDAAAPEIQSFVIIRFITLPNPHTTSVH